MMRVCGVDPGRTTAVVLFDTEAGEVLASAQITERVELVNWFEDHVRESCPVVVIEDFLGAGPRSADTVFTLKILGFIEGWVTHQYGAEIELQPPQWRKPFLDEAQTYFRVHKVRHMKDALAHVFAYLDRIGEYNGA